VAGVEVRNVNQPDEKRSFADKGEGGLTTIGGHPVLYGTFQPGWRWSECVKTVVNTDSCQMAHVGYAVSGRMTIKMNDGTQKTIAKGMSYTIPPGHDGWVEGSEPFVGIEVMSADQYAKPR